MKKQTHPSIKAHLLWSALILLSLLAVCAIPFTLAQSRSRGTTKRSRPASVSQMPASQLQTVTSGPSGINTITIPPAPGFPDALCPNYTFSRRGGTLVPGVTDIGNHCDECSTVIPLPFPVTLYDQTYTSAAAGSNGHLTFGTPDDDFLDITCWPNTAGTYLLAPYWTDQCTGGPLCGNTTCASCGIFTTTTGTAPNRVFYVEYRTTYYGFPGQTTAMLNYEIALYENGTPPFQYIYGTITPAVSPNDSALVVGVKKDDTLFTQYGCDTTGGMNPPVNSGQALTASFSPCVPGCDTGTIQNEGFETGSFPPWVVDSTNNSSPIVSTNNPHTGTQSAFAGGQPPTNYCGKGTKTLGDSSFYQQFTVPAGTSVLSFWHWDCTTDTIAFDWQDAYITNTSGDILQTIFHQCANGHTWINQLVDMTPYAGQTVRIKFLAHQDDAGDLTGMYVDDVQLTVPCGIAPRPTPTPRPRPTPLPRP